MSTNPKNNRAGERLGNTWKPKAIPYQLVLGSICALVFAAGGCGPRTPVESVAKDAVGKPKDADPRPVDKVDDERPLRAGPNPESDPSIVQLLANPDRYHGKKVGVEGFLHVRFEDCSIYLTKD